MNDAAVEFDCNSRGLQIQLKDQTCDSQARGNLAGLSIYLNLQGVIPGISYSVGRMIRRSSAVTP